MAWITVLGQARLVRTMVRFRANARDGRGQAGQEQASRQKIDVASW